ncbi:GMC family oxidoreductase [Acuticoccus mangrovi]|uniref:GMC family oxidoreductase N-terminal domain-containing protein n=1 Tax=Acuticoccus mangrovi TaxID=2796142 RepID=A0A934IM22_9HYPH|nr:GMC family oxidoreductase N-terminal domain-containing protein [Acuticoccus mangrovi]
MANEERITADYVIVGAGSAGCTLAYRLSEDPSVEVVVLEAGEWDRDPLIHIPIGWVRILQQRKHDWMYFCEPEAAVDGRGIECARGKVVGGSSSTNAMAWVRGNRRDFDDWAAAGLAGWGYEDTLPYFKRHERWEGGESALRGGSGPIGVKNCAYEDPLLDAFKAAGAAAGHPWTDDYNGAVQDGFATLQMNIAGGHRASHATHCLRPALKRANCRLLTGAQVTSVDFDGTTATGVTFRHRGTEKVAVAAREVILAGGVINTPQLLMLAGIGDPEALGRHGIATRVPLPGVGANLQDHLSSVVMVARREPGPFHRMMRVDRIAGAVASAYLLGKGFATEVPGGVVAFLKSSVATDRPDIQVMLTAAPITAEPYLEPFKKPFQDAFALRVVTIQPEGRGTVALASADPLAKPLIRQNFLSTERDRRAIVDGVKMMKDILAEAPMAPFVGRELAPGADASEADILAHVRASAITLHHPCGTAAMGGDGDPMAVLDGALRVRGVDRLRVVDGAAMPRITCGNINAPITMMAEKAADLIRAAATAEATVASAAPVAA